MQGVSIGPYRVTRQLGEGAVGRVFEAERGSRRVAIKMLREEHGDAARMLLREAAVVVQLSHPNVVELYDVGRDDEGVLYLVMELVVGTTLRGFVNRAGTTAVLRACDEILDALSAAHAQGIVHGDLKPGNVLLDEDDRVKVTDFGIARILDPLERSGIHKVEGTPHYMAPEQLFEASAVGPAADLYAFGVMLDDILGASGGGARLPLVEVLIRKRLPPKPFVPRSGLRAPAELGQLIDQLRHPDPRRRPRFAAQVRKTLATIGRSIADSPGSSFVLEDAGTLVEGTRATSLQAPQPLSDGGLVPLSADPASTPQAVLRRLRPMPLVGRQAEIAEIMAAVDDVAEGGGPRALVIAGRAGEGKSRLARHGYAEVERNGTMLRAAASFDEHGAGAHVDLQTCMRRLLRAPAAGLGPEQTLADRWAWLGPAAAEIDAEALHAWLQPEAPPVEPAVAAKLAVSALRAASRVCPIYLWLDDVGWSRDGAMPLVLELLATNARVLVVATLRSGTAEHPAVRDWLERVAAHPRAKVSTLPPLDRPGRVRLLRAARVAKPLAEALAGVVDDPTLVLVEAVRDWIDDGLLVESAGGFVAAEGVTVDRLAAGTRNVIARRLDTFLAAFGDQSRRAERVLLHAALISMQFEERVLERCCGGSVGEVLDRASLAGLMRMEGPGVYRFDHQLFADALVRKLDTSSDATAILRETAAALESLDATVSGHASARVAELYLAAGEPTAAFAAMRMAVRLHVRNHVMTEGEACIARLEGWLRDEPRTAIGWGYLHHARGVIHYYALDYEAALPEMRAAISIFTARGDKLQVAAVAIDLSSTLFYLDRLRGSEVIVSGLLGTTDDDVLRSRIHHRMAELCALRCDLEGALYHQRRAVQLLVKHGAGSSMGGIAVVILLTLVGFQALHGDLEEARSLCASLRQQVAGTADHHVWLSFAQADASLAICSNRFEDVEPMVGPFLAEVERRGDRWNLTWLRAALAVAAAARRTEREAEVAVRALIDAYREVHNDDLVVWWEIRVTESLLRGRGMRALAEELGAMLDSRLAEIDRAFEREE